MSIKPQIAIEVRVELTFSADDKAFNPDSSIMLSTETGIDIEKIIIMNKWTPSQIQLGERRTDFKQIYCVNSIFWHMLEWPANSHFN